MNRVFVVDFAGNPIRYSFINKSTPKYFSRKIKLSEQSVYDIRMDRATFDLFRQVHSNDFSDDYVEYKGLIYLTAKKLIEKKCCIFHSVSFIWREKVWLLTGDSGTGKTTQYLNWIHTFPNEITMISGDMPVLAFKNENIMVHSSPWNGKERIGNQLSGRLGGIILLRQGSDNTIQWANIHEKIMTLFRQFAVIPENRVEIECLAEMTEQLIQKVPIWIFKNTGTIESTSILRNTLGDYLDKGVESDV